MEVLMGQPSINGPFSMAMLKNQMVYPFLLIYFYSENDDKPNISEPATGFKTERW
jgi:hypothetical protein